MQDISKQLNAIWQTITNFVSRYRVLIVGTLSVAVILGFFMSVNSLINVTKDEAAYQTALSQTEVPTFNQTTLDNIKQLRDSGAKNPGTDYNSGRTNPFAE